MAPLIHPALCQVNQIVSWRLIFQLWRRPNPVRVDIQSTELPFRSIFSDTGPFLFHSPGRFCANRRALSLRARGAPKSAGASFRTGAASGDSRPAKASNTAHASPAARPSSPAAAASSSATKHRFSSAAPAVATGCPSCTPARSTASALHWPGSDDRTTASNVLPACPP